MEADHDRQVVHTETLGLALHEPEVLLAPCGPARHVAESPHLSHRLHPPGHSQAWPSRRSVGALATLRAGLWFRPLGG